MTDEDLPPFVEGSVTSEAAALSMREKAPSDRERVFGYIDRRGGATCDEVEVALRLIHQNASARVRELAKAGEIVDSGHRRATRTGRSAIVWVKAPEPVRQEAS